MKVGEPFNPYRVFQGAFAPFWLLEHPNLGAGAKLCYVRLIGFAGRDGHCYPSLETLGSSLGVSERQARGYVRELERAGLIAVEQRGLRRTNVYLFLWAADLEGISTVLPVLGDLEPQVGSSSSGSEDSTSGSDRKNSSGQNRKPEAVSDRPSSGSNIEIDSSKKGTSAFGPPDRNTTSALDRNDSSGLDRKSSSGPIGKSSEELGSKESSSSLVSRVESSSLMRKTTCATEQPDDKRASLRAGEAPRESTEMILNWARAQGLRRRRADGAIGLPEATVLREWTDILDRFCPVEAGREQWIGAVMESARHVADGSSDWRNWSFLTLQVQLAAERTIVAPNKPLFEIWEEAPMAVEDPDCAWARAKVAIRAEIGEIPFENWFASSRQSAGDETSITVKLPNAQTKEFIEMEYLDVVSRAVLGIGLSNVEFAIQAMRFRPLQAVAD